MNFILPLPKHIFSILVNSSLRPTKVGSNRVEFSDFLATTSGLSQSKILFRFVTHFYHLQAICNALRYSNHLNTGLLLHSNGRFLSGYQIVRYLNDSLKTGLITGLNKPVYGPKCSVLEWSAVM